MTRSSDRGPLLLTLAQAYHALTGYFIFIQVARALGQDGYGDFGLVIWMMTTLEIFVVDGIPKAVSYFTARDPSASRALLRIGLRVTTLAALLLALLLVAGAPLLAGFWNNQELVLPLRLASLDFITFAAFAVIVQVLNGLHDFSRQAAIWFNYSTWKVLIVTIIVGCGGGISGAALGYAAASLMGSLGAVLLGRGTARRGSEGEAPPLASLAAFGLPVATQSLALLALVNVDLWISGHTDAPRGQKGAYAAAATLARALFFIFRAFGEALFPAVARHLAAGRKDEALRSARKGLALLLALLLPATALATGAARPVLVTLFGDQDYGEGAAFLELLAPAAAGWALAAVLAALVSATARPWRMAAFLAGLLVVDVALVYALARADGPLGAARGALASAGLALLATGGVAVHAFGRVIPWRALLLSLAVSAGLHWTLRASAPGSWWVFVHGAGLYLAALIVLKLSGALPARHEGSAPKAGT